LNRVKFSLLKNGWREGRKKGTFFFRTGRGKKERQGAFRKGRGGLSTTTTYDGKIEYKKREKEVGLL